MSISPAFLMIPQHWDRRGQIVARLAAKADADIRYVTGHVAAFKQAGLLPADYTPEHGEVFVTLIEDRIVLWKCNRKNGSTLAAHFPAGLEIPVVVGGFLEVREYHVTMVGSLRGTSVVQATDLIDSHRAVETPAGTSEVMLQAASQSAAALPVEAAALRLEESLDQDVSTIVADMAGNSAEEPMPR